MDGNQRESFLSLKMATAPECFSVKVGGLSWDPWALSGEPTGSIQKQRIPWTKTIGSFWNKMEY